MIEKLLWKQRLNFLHINTKALFVNQLGIIAFKLGLDTVDLLRTTAGDAAEVEDLEAED